MWTGFILVCLPDDHERQADERLGQRERVDHAHVEQAVVGNGVGRDEEAAAVGRADGHGDDERVDGLGGLVRRTRPRVEAVELAEEDVQQRREVEPQARPPLGDLVLDSLGGDLGVEARREAVVEVDAVAHADVEAASLAGRQLRARPARGRRARRACDGCRCPSRSAGGRARGGRSSGMLHEAVEHLVDRAVAAGGDDEVVAARARGEFGRVPGALGHDRVVRDVARAAAR